MCMDIVRVTFLRCPVHVVSKAINSSVHLQVRRRVNAICLCYWVPSIRPAPRCKSKRVISMQRPAQQHGLKIMAYYRLRFIDRVCDRRLRWQYVRQRGLHLVGIVLAIKSCIPVCVVVTTICMTHTG
jgi:hypothetical protein